MPCYHVFTFPFFSDGHVQNSGEISQLFHIVLLTGDKKSFVLTVLRYVITCSLVEQGQKHRQALPKQTETPLFMQCHVERIFPLRSKQVGVMIMIIMIILYVNCLTVFRLSPLDPSLLFA